VPLLFPKGVQREEGCMNIKQDGTKLIKNWNGKDVMIEPLSKDRLCNESI
jgi:hypothetical protein